MPFVMINESFRCENCGADVPPHPEGSARNHCPKCLFSKHVDAEFPGDRASSCGALMRPESLDSRKNRGTVLMHECLKCNKRIANKISSDDEILAFAAGMAKKLAQELPPKLW